MVFQYMELDGRWQSNQTPQSTEALDVLLAVFTIDWGDVSLAFARNGKDGVCILQQPNNRGDEASYVVVCYFCCPLRFRQRKKQVANGSNDNFSRSHQQTTSRPNKVAPMVGRPTNAPCVIDLFLDSNDSGATEAPESLGELLLTRLGG
jgi:hypothetical protein